MNESLFVGYVRIKSIGNLIASGETSRDGNSPLYNLTARAVTRYQDRYNTETRRYERDIREIDLDFTGLTEKSALMVLPDAEIFITAGRPFSYDAKIGFPAELVSDLLPAPQGKAVSAVDVSNAIANRLGISPETMAQVIPAVRRKTGLQIPTGSWSLKAHPNQIEHSQKAPAAIETPV